MGGYSLGFLKNKNEKQRLVDELKTAMHYAKIQAISRGYSVSLVPIDPNLSWTKGMQLVRLHKKLNQIEVLYQWSWHYSNWNIDWKGVLSQQIKFSPNPLNALSNGRWRIMNRYSKERFELVLNRIGHCSERNN